MIQLESAMIVCGPVLWQGCTAGRGGEWTGGDKQRQKRKAVEGDDKIKVTLKEATENETKEPEAQRK